MIALRDVCYVRLGTRDLDSATRYATVILGLEVSERSPGATYFRSDQREHTLCYFEGDPSEQIAGFEVNAQMELEAAGAELERLGYPVHRGTADEVAQRKVREMIAFRDPSGNRIELVFRPQMGTRGYHGLRDAGITGFSHLGLRSTNPVRDEAFWTSVCNARVSDRIGDAPLLRIDDIHHKIALFPSDHAGIQHINHQVASCDDVQRSWHFLRNHGIPIVFGPGRHPTSGARFLYFEGPDGMIYEYSCGVARIADELLYRERQFAFAQEGFCMWGASAQIAEFTP